jgi:hypothetical protein
LVKIVIATDEKSRGLDLVATLDELLDAANANRFIAPHEYNRGLLKTDAWGNAFHFSKQQSDGNKLVRIASNGPDRIQGSSDDMIATVTLFIPGEPDVHFVGCPKPWRHFPP